MDRRNVNAIITNMASALEAPQQTQAMHPHLRVPITEMHAPPPRGEAANEAHPGGSATLRGRVSTLDGARAGTTCGSTQRPPPRPALQCPMFTPPVVPCVCCCEAGGMPTR